MTSRMANPSKHAAKLAGLLYLILIPVGFFGVAYVPSLLVVPGDMATTMRNIVASESLFRLSMVSAFLMNIISIVIVLLLYRLFKPTGKNMATFMVVFLVIGVCISMLNEVNYFAALVLSSTDSVAVFTAEQTQYLVHLFLDMREYGSYIATIFWGLWLFPLGYLLLKSNSLLPKIIGVSLIIACIGYVIDSFVLFLVPHYLIPLADYTFIGEVLFTLWLLITGADIEAWKKPALEFA